VGNKTVFIFFFYPIYQTYNLFSTDFQVSRKLGKINENLSGIVAGEMVFTAAR
jgi:hypothetical protein